MNKASYLAGRNVRLAATYEPCKLTIMFVNLTGKIHIYVYMTTPKNLKSRLYEKFGFFNTKVESSAEVIIFCIYFLHISFMDWWIINYNNSSDYNKNIMRQAKTLFIKLSITIYCIQTVSCGLCHNLQCNEWLQKSKTL